MAIDRLPPLAPGNSVTQPGGPSGAPAGKISAGQTAALQQALDNAPGRPSGQDLVQALTSAGIIAEPKNAADAKRLGDAASRAFDKAGLQVGEPISDAQRETLGATLAANGVPITAG